MKEENNVFDWLQHWYASQCDGDWEHSFGITIKTVDNPGWYLIINLTGTEIEKVPFETIEYETSETDWYYCQLRDKNFDSSCGPLNLTIILHTFREWVKAISPISKKIDDTEKMHASSVFDWLQNWYYSHCDGDWEHSSRIAITTTDNPGWHITINLSETQWEDIQFNSIKYESNDTDWYYCKIKDNEFESACSEINLTLVIQLFRDWIEKNQGIKIDK